LNDHESRVGFLEYAIFKSDKSEDRFEQLFRKMGEMEQSRVRDLATLESTWINHKSDIDTMCFEQDSKL